MQISDNLEADIRDRILNWRRLRGSKPFYSGLFWPPRWDETGSERLISAGKPTIPPLPNILVLGDFILPEEVEAAMRAYPEAEEKLQKLKEAMERFRLGFCHSDQEFMKRGRRNATFMSSRAFELEFFSRRSQMSALDIRNLALKIDAFISPENQGISLLIPSPDGSNHVEFFGNVEKRFQSGKGRLLRKDDMKFIWERCEASIPASNFVELSMYCADIASQGHDSVILTDISGCQYTLAGVGFITSVQDIGEALLQILPAHIKPMDNSPRTKRGEFLVRPFANIEAGVRFFIRDRRIIASTPMRSSATLRSEQLIDGRVGTKPIKSDSIRSRTEFADALDDEKIFGVLKSKAEQIAAATPQPEVQQYALDVLLKTDGGFVVDIGDFLSVDMFDIDPAALFRQIVDHDVEQMFKQVAPLHVLSRQEFMHFLHCELSQEQIRLFDNRDSGIFASRTKVTPAALVFSPRNDLDDLTEFVDAMGQMRSLLKKDRVVVPFDCPPDIEDQVRKLAECFGILPCNVGKYDLYGFVQTIVADFHKRCLGPRIELIVADLFSMLPLMEAVRWYCGQGEQTWSYRSKSQSEGDCFYVTSGAVSFGLT